MPQPTFHKSTSRFLVLRVGLSIDRQVQSLIKKIFCLILFTSDSVLEAVPEARSYAGGEVDESDGSVPIPWTRTRLMKMQLERT